MIVAVRASGVLLAEAGCTLNEPEPVPEVPVVGLLKLPVALLVICHGGRD